MSELPNGWKEYSFMDILDIQGGSQPPKSKFIYEEKDGYVRFLQIRDFGNKPHATYIPIAKNNKLCNDDDILIARYGASIGRICTGMSGAYNVAMAKVIIPDSVYKKYVYYLLKSHAFQNEILRIERSAQDGFNKDDLEKIILPFPQSIDEQKKIVERLELLLGKINTANERLNKIPAILKRFRQSVLSAACNGQLTAEWREGKDLPEWKSKKINDVLPKGGIFDGPFGSNLKTSDYIDYGVRVIRLENISTLKFINEKTAFISPEKYDALKKHTVCAGDIIFSSFIANNTRVCILPELDTLAIAKADCFCIRPNQEIINKTFLCYVLSSIEIYHTLFNLIHGATRPRINTTQLKQLSFELPPLPEQEEIVHRVDKLFAIIGIIEERYNNVKKQLERAEKAIYAKAFKGEF